MYVCGIPMSEFLCTEEHVDRLISMYEVEEKLHML